MSATPGEGRRSSPLPGNEGEASLELLRRRHEQLRGEYADLVERLSGIEARIRDASSEVLAPPPGLIDQVRGPLLRLRQEYHELVGHLVQLVDGLDEVIARERPPAAGRFRAQRGSTVAPPRADVTRVSIVASDAGALLDFQAHLRAFPGVRTVTTDVTGSGRATYRVELERGPGAG